jgi:hypothetical protein
VVAVLLAGCVGAEQVPLHRLTLAERVGRALGGELHQGTIGIPT